MIATRLASLPIGLPATETSSKAARRCLKILRVASLPLVGVNMFVIVETFLQSVELAEY